MHFEALIFWKRFLKSSSQICLNRVRSGLRSEAIVHTQIWILVHVQARKTKIDYFWGLHPHFLSCLTLWYSWPKNVLQFWLCYIRKMVQFHVVDLIKKQRISGGFRGGGQGALAPPPARFPPNQEPKAPYFSVSAPPHPKSWIRHCACHHIQ